ncbi:hypothetical protein [Robertmurraya andreesenii]|uniref:Tetrahydromethanopterin S-methyltransferase subunit G n=1 Tax=Anoxybacillus andreesenii TaxID=1325932 RepID=A0ABT9V955_9BACL|nr:hypothetical protein [Robertmurraya andreesenii]MDQ0157474.1 tetrahydromethanopterin S-methyltransferase subunit G [Robertmurraya andreesenii]
MEKVLQLILDKLDSLENSVQQLTQVVAATNVKISETNERLDRLEEKVDTVVEEVKGLRTI